MKLATKISLSFFITGTIMTFIGVFVGYVSIKKSLETGIYSNLRAISQSRARHIETFINEDKSRIELIAKTWSLVSLIEKINHDPENSDNEREMANIFLQRVKEIETEAYEIFIVNNEGLIIASINEDILGQDRSNMSYFLNAREKTYITDVSYSETSNNRLYSISTPIIQENTERLPDVLVANFNMDGLNEITTNSTGLGKTGEVFVVNRHGMMITPSRFVKNTFLKEKEGTFCPIPAITQNILFNEGEINIFPSYKDVMVLGTHEYIPELEWCVLAEINVDEAMAPLNKIKKIFLIILICIPLASWLMGVFFSRRLINPIKKLQRSTEIVGRGDLNHETGMDDKDEIGQLSAAFDKMTRDLRRTTTSITELNNEIAERKRAEKSLKKAKEIAEAANTSKSQFLANVSHELRTPMNSVLGFADLMKETPMNDTQRDFIETISSSGHLLLDLINNILDLSKIEKQGVQLENTPFDIRRIAENVMKIIKPRVNEIEVKLILEIPEEMPVNYSGDQTAVHQILLNLLSNSIKFTNKGEIVLSLSAHKALPEKNVMQVKITVKDTGAGISEEKQKVIFDAFIQEDGSTTRQFGGTGLGLTIVRRLVDAMKGEVNVSSKKGEGSEFSVIIPLQKYSGPKNPEYSQTAATDKTSLMGRRILLVEDNIVNLKLLINIIDRMDCVSDTAIDGLEAIERLKNNNYDIVFMDVQLPGMNGIDVTRFIRREMKSSVPVIGLTAAALDDDREKAMSAGMSDYMVKPVNAQDIDEMLLKWINADQHE